GERAVCVAHPEDDHITPVEVIADWMAGIGGGELAVVHGADHYLQREAGDVARQIAGFLARALAGWSPLESGA
ncbi:MAG: alpha/beta fold hydrolase, partial [Miltoncostaeaceae bacterium]